MIRQARMASLITMIAGVVLYVARPFLSTAIQDFKVTILFVELLGFFGFATHWLVMTRVIDKANKRINKRRKLLKSHENAIAADSDFKASQPGAIDADEEDLLKIP